MQSLAVILLGTLAVQAAPAAAPAPAVLDPRATLCTIIGTTTLPQEVADIATTLANTVTCNTAKTTIGKVPDATSGNITYSSIDFSQSSDTPLAFALKNFATEDNLAGTDLATFQNELAVYQATEAGIRSTGGSLTIKAPKFFLQFQVSRIQTAQGNPPTAAGSQVDHLLQKVIKNSPKESQSLKDQVTALSKKLS